MEEGVRCKALAVARELLVMNVLEQIAAITQLRPWPKFQRK